jgi:hypothetical protein
MFIRTIAHATGVPIGLLLLLLVLHADVCATSGNGGVLLAYAAMRRRPLVQQTRDGGIQMQALDDGGTRRRHRTRGHAKEQAAREKARGSGGQ